MDVSPFIYSILSEGEEREKKTLVISDVKHFSSIGVLGEIRLINVEKTGKEPAV